jgi:hypothetical protein
MVFHTDGWNPGEGGGRPLVGNPQVFSLHDRIAGDRARRPKKKLTPSVPFHRTTVPYPSRSVFSITLASLSCHHHRNPIPGSARCRCVAGGVTGDTTYPRCVLRPWDVADCKSMSIACTRRGSPQPHMMSAVLPAGSPLQEGGGGPLLRDFSQGPRLKYWRVCAALPSEEGLLSNVRGGGCL